MTHPSKKHWRPENSSLQPKGIVTPLKAWSRQLRSRLCPCSHSFRGACRRPGPCNHSCPYRSAWEGQAGCSGRAERRQLKTRWRLACRSAAQAVHSHGRWCRQANLQTRRPKRETVWCSSWMCLSSWLSHARSARDVDDGYTNRSKEKKPGAVCGAVPTVWLYSPVLSCTHVGVQSAAKVTGEI
jgi:hypothetical protein